MHDSTTNPPRRRLSDILANGQSGNLRDVWNRTEAAADFAPLPARTYTARVVSGELFNSKSGTPGYKLAFRVLEGEHAGRQFWHDLWLTPAARRTTNVAGASPPVKPRVPMLSSSASAGAVAKQHCSRAVAHRRCHPPEVRSPCVLFRGALSYEPLLPQSVCHLISDR